MVRKMWKKAIAMTLAGVLTFGGSTLMAYAEEDVVLDTESYMLEVRRDVSPTLVRTAEVPMILDEEDADEDTDTVLYQKNVVRFVTSYSESRKLGADFKVQDTDEYELPDGVKSVEYSIIGNGFEEDVDSIAVWDVLYEDDAVELGVLPELVLNDSDAFSGWVDADGKSVDEKTKPEPGAMYYAVFDSKIVEPESWLSVLTNEENALFQPAAVVTYVISEKSGQIYGQFDNLDALQVDGVDSIKISQDEMSLFVAYTEDGSFGVLPEVKPVDGYQFTGWVDEESKVFDAKDEYEDGLVLTAQFEKSDSAKADDETDSNPDDVKGNITVDTGNSGNAGDTEQNQGGTESEGNDNKPMGVVSQNPPHLCLYVLHVTDTIGATKDVKVQSDKSLDELAEALSYDVSGWAIKQANVAEYKVEGSMTMESVVELFKNGDIEVIAYDSENKPMGCAVAKVTSKDLEYDVLLSKDTNVALRTADEIESGKDAEVDGKGKDENTVSKEGKPDEVAPAVQTSDSMSWLIYCGIAIALIIAFGGYLAYTMMKKKSQDEAE